MRMIDADAAKSFAKECWLSDAIRLPIDAFLDSCPTVDAVPVIHGHWIFNRSLPATCSVCNRICGSYDDDNADRYCSNCGAKMDGDYEDEKEKA